jgi:hypothetical protein
MPNDRGDMPLGPGWPPPPRPPLRPPARPPARPMPPPRPVVFSSCRCRCFETWRWGAGCWGDPPPPPTHPPTPPPHPPSALHARPARPPLEPRRRRREQRCVKGSSCNQQSAVASVISGELNQGDVVPKGGGLPRPCEVWPCWGCSGAGGVWQGGCVCGVWREGARGRSDMAHGSELQREAPGELIKSGARGSQHEEHPGTKTSRRQ